MLRKNGTKGQTLRHSTNRSPDWSFLSNPLKDGWGRPLEFPSRSPHTPAVPILVVLATAIGLLWTSPAGALDLAFPEALSLLQERNEVLKASDEEVTRRQEEKAATGKMVKPARLRPLRLGQSPELKALIMKL